MADREKILRTVFNAVEDVNLQLPEERQIHKSENTLLFGESARLTSLDLVNLIVKTEQKVAEEFDTVLTLADEKAMSQKYSPFRTVGTLTAYIASLLENGSNG